MEDRETIFEEYMNDKTLREKMRTPKFWVKYVLIVFSAFFLVILYNSYRNTWSKEDVKESIEIFSYETGWVESKSALKEAPTRILPYISFKVKNVGDKPLHFVNIECVFEFKSDGKTQTTGFAAAFKEPLPAGDISGNIVIKGVNGYKASSKEAFYKNIENWKKVNAKLFARTKGSPHVRVGGLFPVEQKIKGVSKEVSQNDNKIFSGEVELILIDTGWIYKRLEGKKVLIYPSIVFKIKNIGDTVLRNMVMKGVFVFEKNGERFNFGFPSIKDNLNPDSLSDEIVMRSEFGITASSLQSLYDNVYNWDEVMVKVLIKEENTEYKELGEFKIKKEVKGVKVINEVRGS